MGVPATRRMGCRARTADAGAVCPGVVEGDAVKANEAWLQVMKDVQALGKNQRVETGLARFNFRGVDDVMNAVGPALRAHGVAVVPAGAQVNVRDVQTSTGKPSREATVLVTYKIIGPEGDSIEGASCGEAMDAGDKATPKAMSVAFRTFLLEALCLPTGDPDPDSHIYERASEKVETPTEQAMRGIASASGTAVLDQIKTWAIDGGVWTDQVAEAWATRAAALAAATAA